MNQSQQPWNTSDPAAATQPLSAPDPMAQYQPIRIQRPAQPLPPPVPARSRGCCGCVVPVGIALVLALGLVLGYFLAPLHTNLLVLGIDRVPDGTALGRSDTMILVSVNPLLPTVKMLSIPRDLWVNIPGVGENRINTAHFFAEANQPGSGPAAAAQTVEENFGVAVPYYVRVRFDAFLNVVNALGGVTVDVPREMAGLSPGPQHLTGEQALAFARDRKGADDFFRMEDTQILVKAIAAQVLAPASWSRLPAVAQAGLASVDTNLPFWQWPRLGLAILRAVTFGGLDNRTIQREMTVPTITSGGANVLMPRWDLIRPYVEEMFAQ